MASFTRAANTLAASVILVVGCAAQTSTNSNEDTSRDWGHGPVIVGPGSSSLEPGYAIVDLVSDNSALAPRTDPHLVDAWGMAMDAQAFWIADSGTGFLSIYDANGNPATLDGSGSGTKPPPPVVVPNNIELGAGITGVVRLVAEANGSDSTATAPFEVSNATDCGQAQVLIANRQGQILAINTDVDAKHAFTVVDRSAVHASYTGLAIVTLSDGSMRLIAPDFYNARVDVFDGNFQLVTTAPFALANAPAGYAPFNAVAIGTSVFVTYAQQDDRKLEPVPGEGLGLLAEFDVSGNFIKRVIDVGGVLDAPWGVALATTSFSAVEPNELIVGNYGDGHISIIDETSGMAIAQLADQKGNALEIDSVMSLMFGDGEKLGQAGQLFFTAGPTGEKDGLFGYIHAVGVTTKPTQPKTTQQVVGGLTRE